MEEGEVLWRQQRQLALEVLRNRRTWADPRKLCALRVDGERRHVHACGQLEVEEACVKPDARSDDISQLVDTQGGVAGVSEGGVADKRTRLFLDGRR